MGEGEVCVAVVSNVGEMENENSQQKRDHQWLTGDSDREPVAKKQVKEDSVDDEVNFCAMNQSEVDLDSFEEKPCASRLPTEGLDVIDLKPCVEQIMKESSIGLELEPRCRRQTAESLSDNMLDTSDKEPVQACFKGTKQQTCDTKQSLESLNYVDVNISVEQPVKEGLNDLEPDPSSEKRSSGVSNDMEMVPVIEQPVKECLNEMELETHGSMQRTEVESDTGQGFCGRETTGAKSDIEPEPSIKQPVNECLYEMETDACVKIQATEPLNENEPELSVQQPLKECLNEMELETHGSMQRTEVESDIGQGFCGGETTGAKSDIEPELSIKQPVNECLYEMETDACVKIQATEPLNESEPELSIQQPVKECLHDMKLEVYERQQTTQSLNDTGTEPSSVIKQTAHVSNNTKLELSAVQSVNECQNDIVTDACCKKEVKEASNDDISSEVSNPNTSPLDTSLSFQTVNSQPDGKLVTKDQAVCGEITSACFGNSSSEGSSSQEEHGTNDTSVTLSTSHVVIEVPKHASTSSGIRKITFKFSKRKEDYDDQLSASAVKCMGSAFDNRTRKVPRLTYVSEQGLHEPGDSSLYPNNTEVMHGKAIPEGYPTTVKRLLLTKILEGAKVKYISASGELIGIVKDCGYLCGCATCNFSNVLRAHEFEGHAGGKTKHPNNHIYLENGKPIYSVIQAMKTAPISTVDEAIRNVAGSSVNEEFLQAWKESLQRNTDRAKIDDVHHMKLMNLYHSTTRPRSYTSSTAAETKRSAEGGHKKRDNDLHRLLFMPNGLPDGTELAYYARGKKILDGYKQGNGIFCSHCDTEISPSQFEAHAGWAAKRQPYRHIYIPNGLTLHDIALLLANGQSIATSKSDDMCAVCGDSGELVMCDGCPRAFHAGCLGPEDVTSEDWHCPYCRDSVCSGRKTAAESRPIVVRLTRVVKAREYETGGCVICRAHDFSVAEFDDRTVMLCDQCEKEYHVGCLRESGRCDLMALPSDKWFCCDHCDMIHGAIQDVVVNGATVISGSVKSTINKKHKEKGVVSGAPNEIRWQILSGKSRYPEHLPLLSRAAAIFRECFDPIVAKSGRDLIPVMVYGRNISGQEFGGIYCVVMMVGSVVVSAGLLRIFGREVAELPIVATTRQHRGKGYFQALFFCIEELLLSLGVELLVLPAAEEAESIWTKKLGFRKMSDERYSQYSRDVQLTIFKGTSMLEKELHHATL